MLWTLGAIVLVFDSDGFDKIWQGSLQLKTRVHLLTAFQTKSKHCSGIFKCSSVASQWYDQLRIMWNTIIQITLGFYAMVCTGTSWFSPAFLLFSLPESKRQRPHNFLWAVFPLTQKWQTVRIFFLALLSCLAIRCLKWICLNWASRAVKSFLPESSLHLASGVMLLKCKSYCVSSLPKTI